MKPHVYCLMWWRGSRPIHRLVTWFVRDWWRWSRSERRLRWTSRQRSHSCNLHNRWPPHEIWTDRYWCSRMRRPQLWVERTRIGRRQRLLDSNSVRYKTKLCPIKFNCHTSKRNDNAVSILDIKAQTFKTQAICWAIVLRSLSSCCRWASCLLASASRRFSSNSLSSRRRLGNGRKGTVQTI